MINIILVVKIIRTLDIFKTLVLLYFGHLIKLESDKEMYSFEAVKANQM